MIRFLQINLDTARLALDLVQQSAIELGADVLVIQDQNRTLPGWYSDSSGRAALAVVGTCRVEEVGESGDGFVWLRINGVRVYSCYVSPNILPPMYDNFLERLESSIRAGSGEVLVAGDFNAKRPEWGSPPSDRRGDQLADLLASLGLVVCNVGDQPTFVRHGSQSFIDVTFASLSLSRQVVNWRVLEEDTGSLHRYITYEVNAAGPPCPAPRPKGWAVRNMNLTRLEEFLAENTMEEDNDELTGHERLNAYLVDACDISMPRASYRGRKKAVHWWTPRIAELRKASFLARRRFQRARRRSNADACLQLELDMKAARKALRIEVRRSQEQCWRRLCEEVENDPWGLPYRLVTKRLRSVGTTTGSHDSWPS